MRSTIGAVYLGVVVAAMFYGVTNVQVYFYIRKYRQDRTVLKCVVAFLWMMDTLHMVFTIVEPWHYLIDEFGNNPGLLTITWSHKLQQSINVMIVLTVQSLYTWRVWKLSRNQSQMWLWILSAVLLVGYGAGITLVVMTCKLQSFAEVIHIHWEILFAFAVSTSNDFALAAGICHLLLHSVTPLRETKSMLWIIMRYVLISGTLTSMCSLVGLIIFCVMPNNLVFLGVTFIITKLYINSYFAMLNARRSIRDRGSIVNKTVLLSGLEMRFSTTSRSEGMHNSCGAGAEAGIKNQRPGSLGGEGRNTVTDLISESALNKPTSPVFGDDAC